MPRYILKWEEAEGEGDMVYYHEKSSEFDAPDDEAAKRKKAQKDAELEGSGNSASTLLRIIE